MSLSMHQASVGVFVKVLSNLKVVLQKAEAHAQAKKIEEKTLLDARLYPDMFNSLLKTEALEAFRDLLRVFTDRLARTTNAIRPTW